MVGLLLLHENKNISITLMSRSLETIPVGINRSLWPCLDPDRIEFWNELEGIAASMRLVQWKRFQHPLALD